MGADQKKLVQMTSQMYKLLRDRTLVCSYELRQEFVTDLLKMTYQELLQYGTVSLREAGVPEADLDARYLFEVATGMNRGIYYIHLKEQAERETVKAFQSQIELRRRRIPVQRILGIQEFMGLSFYCQCETPGAPFENQETYSPDALIPRQETEILTELAVEYVKGLVKRTCNKAKGGRIRILDMCTGTGCIPISILKLCDNEANPVTGVAADLSETALCVARRNRKLHALTEQELMLVRSDLFQEIPREKYDLITANPPYIPSKAIEELEPEVKNYDPRMALDGGQDGLDFYRRMIPEAEAYLNKGGMILLEIGYDQGKAVEKMLLEAGYENVRIFKDLSGLDRIVVASSGDLC